MMMKMMVKKRTMWFAACVEIRVKKALQTLYLAMLVKYGSTISAWTFPRTQIYYQSTIYVNSASPMTTRFSFPP